MDGLDPVGGMTARASAVAPGGCRLAAGFAILPLFDALVAFVSSPVVWWLGDHGGFRPVDSTGAASGFAIVAGVMSVLVTLVAVPVVYWLIRRDQVSVGRLATAGLLLGNIPFAVYVVALIPFAIGHIVGGTMAQHLMSVPDLIAGTLRALAMGSTMGVLSALVFWLVAFARVGR